MSSECFDLTDELVSHYRQVLLTHAATPESGGACPVCGMVRCPDWLDAYDKLAAAGQPMGAPALWEPFVPGWKRPRQR
jgi:hypothetical protein